MTEYLSKPPLPPQTTRTMTARTRQMTLATARVLMITSQAEGPRDGFGACEATSSGNMMLFLGEYGVGLSSGQA